MLVGVNTIPARGEAAAPHEDRYLQCILNTVRTLETASEFVVFTHPGNHDVFTGCARILLAVHSGGFTSWGGGRKVLEQAVKQAQVELLLSPLDSASPDAPVPQVLYSLSLARWLGEPGNPSRHGSRLRAVKQACANARAVLVPSEHLRRKCLDLFEAPLDKTVVAPPGVAAVFGRSHAPVVARPYLLTFNDTMTEARLPDLREAFSKRRQEFTQTLVIAGQGLEPEPSDWGPRTLRVEQCPEAFLASLYQHSALFVYPAEYDGSAMRIMEALRAGAIVVTPHTGSTDELAGNAPFYYNPASTASFLQAVRRAIDLDPAKREERIHLGKNIAAQYTWVKTAWRILSAFKRG